MSNRAPIALPTIPPELSTDRLTLVAPDPANHAADLYRYGTDPAFLKYLDAAPFADVAQARAFAEGLVRDNGAGKRLYWAVIWRETGAVIGTLGLIFPFALKHRTAEYGYGLDPAYWGSGVFQEASAVVFDFAFTVLGFERIQALTKTTNVKAIKGVEKLGFVWEATFQNFYELDDGTRGDAAVLALMRSRWQSGLPASAHRGARPA